MKQTISQKIFDTLTKGKKRLSREALGRMAVFVGSQRTPEESFLNRSGHPDLYYTMFGWILSYVLGIRQDCSKMLLYLNGRHVPDMDLVHYAAWVRCRMICRLRQWGRLGMLSGQTAHRYPGAERFHSVPNNDPWSPYSQYILLSLREDAEMEKGSKETILNAIASYKVPGGGYANRINAPAATTNATVAALAVCGQLAGYHAGGDAAYLQHMQEPSGGFRATAESPVPDLLSTATALFMLKCYGMEPAYTAEDFIEAHWLDNGGFAATLLDDTGDVEYTFYGLLALGSL